VRDYVLIVLLLVAVQPCAALELGGADANPVLANEESEPRTCLVLGEALGGRFIVRSADGELVAELYKNRGRTAVLGLEPGTYEVRSEQGEDSSIATPTLEEGQRLVLGPGDFVAQEAEVSTGLVFGEALSGRFFVRNAYRELVAELHKPLGRTVELSLEPGAYEVRNEDETGIFVSLVAFREGEVLSLGPEDFVRPEAATVRTGSEEEPCCEPEPAKDALVGRHRLELRFGAWERGWNPGGFRDGSWGVWDGSGSQHGSVSLSYSHWVSESLALTVTATGLGAEFEIIDDWYPDHDHHGPHEYGPHWPHGGDYDDDHHDYDDSTVEGSGIGSFLVGFRQYLLDGETIKPFLAGSLGSYYGGESYLEEGPWGVWTDWRGEMAFGGYVGAGFDVRLSRSWMLGVSGGYNFMADFQHPIGNRDNYSSAEGGVSISWLFGG
jgi:hypothetical protein